MRIGHPCPRRSTPAILGALGALLLLSCLPGRLSKGGGTTDEMRPTDTGPGGGLADGSVGDGQSVDQIDSAAPSDAAGPNPKESGLVLPDSCVPACSGKQCGDDGCGGSCGQCAAGQSCGSAGTCAAAKLVDMQVSYYGWPDNDPPGDGITYLIKHKTAGGVGTYDDPISYATKKGFLSPGEIVYVPYIKKYGILEDDCAGCTDDWIDVWMTSDANSGSAATACEGYWWRKSTPVELDPPPDRPVNTAPLLDTTTKSCMKSIP